MNKLRVPMGAWDKRAGQILEPRWISHNFQKAIESGNSPDAALRFALSLYSINFSSYKGMQVIKPITYLEFYAELLSLLPKKILEKHIIKNIALEDAVRSKGGIKDPHGLYYKGDIQLAFGNEVQLEGSLYLATVFFHEFGHGMEDYLGIFDKASELIIANAYKTLEELNGYDQRWFTKHGIADVIPGYVLRSDELRDFIARQSNSDIRDAMRKIYSAIQNMFDGKELGREDLSIYFRTAEKLDMEISGAVNSILDMSENIARIADAFEQADQARQRNESENAAVLYFRAVEIGIQSGGLKGTPKEFMRASQVLNLRRAWIEQGLASLNLVEIAQHLDNIIKTSRDFLVKRAAGGLRAILLYEISIKDGSGSGIGSAFEILQQARQTETGL
ncbi:MAG: hypothetical protein NTX47_04710 [Candidatus Omnitrophica bacterium]|nr:hypothetical protein [Candidatus Omnitrophota bacterium]